MSELINSRGNRATVRWKLLTCTSVLALATNISLASLAKAADASRPQIWIDLGGQLAWTEIGQPDFLPPFTLTTPRPAFETTSPGEVERRAPTSWDEYGKLSVQPAGSDWVFSAGIRYGKSSHHDYLNQVPQSTFKYRVWAFQNITDENSEHHTIVDFQVGRDFGLGAGANSTVRLGVRIAQFNSEAHTHISSKPQNFNASGGTYTVFNATTDAKRSFSGIGPSLSWDGTAAIAGNSADGEIDVNWGANAALLFGRQKVSGFHTTTTVVYPSYNPAPPIHHTAPVNRRKQVVVPNVGGFAGLSWRLPTAKVAIGYRADFFFGAIDGGVDTRRAQTVGFYGPFASVSIGLGG